MPAARALGDGRRPSGSYPAHFTFSGLGLPEDEDPLGIWELVPSPPVVSDGQAPFVAQEADAGDGEGLRWRVDLPASLKEARSELSRRLAAARARQAQLDVVEQRLLQLGGPQAYAVSSGPESDLMVEAAALWAASTAYAGGYQGAVSYGLISEKADQLLRQFRRLVQYYARVETAVGGQLVALTAVDWSGDYETTWQDDVSVSDMDLHLDAVRLALASRQALVRLVGVVTSGALSLASKASVPGGQILLLPAVYNYVRDVLEELSRYAESRGLS
ncbi:MAG: hypothetical protein JXC32_02100 [Anaerolineae bacterium]|nr:hypothetical protein [Anaerolineae bacterium]